MKVKIGRGNLDPTQILVISFMFLILTGAILLNLPMASREGDSIGFINALFTSTSAVCVTGLIVVDTGTYWSTFGRVVIISLIQIGGLGFMTMATMFFIILGKRISLKERLVMQEALNQYSLAGIIRFTKYIIICTLTIEGIGALFLSLRFIPEFGWIKGIGYSIFHSISAFCNAGFDLIGNGRGLMPYVSDPIVNLTICGLIIIGGIGFSVIVDLINHRNLRNLSLHSKIVLFITASLICTGFIILLILEWNNTETLGKLGLNGKLLAALFQSVSPRTAGFNTVNLAKMTDPSKLITIILMYIGGSPGSTAGGIKTATLGVILFTVFSVIRGKEETELFKRSIGRDIVNRSIAVAVIGITLVMVITIILMISEIGFSFEEILFEVVSAFATVGSTLGMTSSLSNIGKTIIIFMMFAGRVGPLTIAYALARQQHKNKGMIKYPEEKILVG